MEKINIRKKINFTPSNKNIKKKIVATLITMLPILLMCVFTLRLKPSFYSFCEIRAKNLANKTINKVILNEMSNVDYNNLIVFEKNSENQINMIRLNSVMMNTLSSKMSIEIQEEFSKLKDSSNTINIPLGSLISDDVFSSIRTTYKSKNNSSRRCRDKF